MKSLKVLYFLILLIVLGFSIPNRVQGIQLDCPGSTQKIWLPDKQAYGCDDADISRAQAAAPVVQTPPASAAQPYAAPPVIAQAVPYSYPYPYWGGVPYWGWGPGFYFGTGFGYYYPHGYWGQYGMNIVPGGHHGHHY